MHTDWSLFFGRFHPLLVHVPIGIILFAAILTVVAQFNKSALLSSAINIALLCSAVSAAFAAASGYFLSTAGGYNEQTLFWHKWIGIVSAILVFVIWLIRKRKKGEPVVLKIPLSSWLLYVSILLISIGGHLGGNMTHGEGYLTAYMPGFLKAVFVSEKVSVKEKPLPPLDSVNVFADIIQPMVNAKCITCHNPGKQQGDLDLSNVAGFIKGGKSGNTIVAGDLEKSELFHRVTMSKHSSKFMPADNRPPLTPVEISFLRWWIQTGGDYTKNITALGVDEKTKYFVAAYLGIDAENNKEIILPEVAPADSIVLQQLKGMKIIVRSLTSKSNLLDVSFVMAQSADATQVSTMLQKLSAIKNQVYRLDVSGCTLTKDAMKTIAGFEQLHKLEIQKCNVTDDVLEALTGLQRLEILNAYQNSITDKSISVFKKLSALKKLNVWQTQITENGAKELAGLQIER